jgi:pimeloyl-ACP methyl ester carboxylesterase
VELHYYQNGEGPPLVILHGFLGMADNWRSQALLFGTRYTVYCVDQRNHGRSPWGAPFDYPTLAADLLQFANHHQLERFTLLGHSMGGKTAMEFARQNAHRLDKLVVADIAPVAYAPHHQSVLAALNAVPLHRLQNRTQAEEAMKAHLPNDAATRQFLLKSLVRETDGTFGWRFNLELLTQAYANILAGVDYDQPIATPTLFVRGGKSQYVDDAGLAKARAMFSNLETCTLPNAGHWVHAEAPEAFYQAVAEFLARP